MHKHILISTDGSELSQKALDYGMDLAKSVGAKVTVMTVSPPFHMSAVEPMRVAETPDAYEKYADEVARKRLNAAKLSAAAAGIPCQTLHVVHEQPYQAIVDTAAKNACDLILMASHGRRGVSAIVLGSETVKVLTHSTIPVLVYRAPHYSPLGVVS